MFEYEYSKLEVGSSLYRSIFDSKENKFYFEEWFVAKKPNIIKDGICDSCFDLIVGHPIKLKRLVSEDVTAFYFPFDSIVKPYGYEMQETCQNYENMIESLNKRCYFDVRKSKALEFWETVGAELISPKKREYPFEMLAKKLHDSLVGIESQEQRISNLEKEITDEKSKLEQLTKVFDSENN